MTYQPTRKSHQFIGSKVLEGDQVVFCNNLMPPHEKIVLLGTKPTTCDNTEIFVATDGDYAGHIFVLDSRITVNGHRPKRILSTPFVPTDMLLVRVVTHGDCILAAGHGLQSGVALIGIKSGLYEWVMYDLDLREHPKLLSGDMPPLRLSLDLDARHATVSCGKDWNRDITPPLRRNKILWPETTKRMHHYQRTYRPRHPLLSPEL
jgi:hypothetical protein